MNKQAKLIKLLEKNNLRPHHWDVLLSIEGKSKASFDKEGKLYLFLKDNGWVLNDTLTQKSENLLSRIENMFKAQAKPSASEVLGADYKDKLKEYVEIFPKGKLPSGKPARVALSMLEKNMVWLFQESNEVTWDKVMVATKAYVSEFRSKNYEFMRTSYYFIKREERSGGITSDLLTYIENGTEEKKELEIKFNIF